MLTLRKIMNKEKSFDEEIIEIHNKIKTSTNKKEFIEIKNNLEDILNKINSRIEKIRKQSELEKLNKLSITLNQCINSKSKKELVLLIEQIIPEEKKEKEFDYSKLKIPLDLKEEIFDDLNEIEKCFNSNCNKASIVMCGRVLETSLHRLYYDHTGNDLLEKAPGLGLGKLIAHLRNKNIILDPAIMQQIHLINETRIYSVHKKKETFYPSKEQTRAIILYTIDILKKIFK